MHRELTPNRRILLIDDNPAIHEDFRKALAPHETAAVASLIEIEAALFGDSQQPLRQPEVTFEIHSALQGANGVQLLRDAMAEGRPFALAFVDIRMPPGWDGVETIERLWSIDPDLQVAICSAYSDYSGNDIRRRLGESDGLLILKKPFDTTEVAQLAHAMTRKWSLQRAQRDRSAELDALVLSRTFELEQTNRALGAEMQRRERVEANLRLSQKLESIGQLAAGIAHEINTPIQYVTDNVEFLRTSYFDLEKLRVKLRAACAHRDAHRQCNKALDEIEALEREVDLDFVTENAPHAFEAAQQGLARIGRIVQAMRVFGHHETERKPSDLNSIVMSTLEVSRNEYRMYADVETELAELPPVTCCRGELGQVFLNLIVNAAHAIESVMKDTGERGTIRVRTVLDGNAVAISIEDTGCGIPEQVRERIFDPFFTTKDVGRGTGQGLAIARSIVVDGHRGSLSVTSAVGQGTTFMVRIPIGVPESNTIEMPKVAAAGR
jgi:two-component system, NtrC family, sensor kinase